MFKKHLIGLAFIFIMSNSQAMNVTYISTDKDIPLSDVLNYQLCDGSSCNPYFDMAVLHEVDIYNSNGTDGKNPNDAILQIKPGAQKMLNDQTSIDLLHKNGIKVLASIVGDHQYAGWSCFTDEDSAATFANSIVDMVNKYHLDGIDIDDEYSTCPGNSYSMIMVVNDLKNNPGFHGKIVSKALWNDNNVFTSSYKNIKLADLLNYGWEMSYGDVYVDSILQNYVTYGLGKNQLLAGMDYGIATDVTTEAQNTKDGGYNGIMYYSLGNHPSSQNLEMLNKAAKVQYDSSVEVKYTGQ